MIDTDEEKQIEELASKLLSYYSRNPNYSVSGSGFLKIFKMLSEDIVNQRLSNGLFLLLEKDGKVSADQLDKTVERNLTNLSAVYYGLVERYADKGIVYYKLSDDIISVLYRVFNSVQRLKSKKLEVYSIIQKRRVSS